MSNIPTIALVGRPNVGKSRLFNCLTSSNKAIVENLEGVTRDRNYAPVSYLDKTFRLIDTGGFVPNSNAEFNMLVQDQALIATSEADLIIQVVDGKGGYSSIDKEILNTIKLSKKPIILAVNKIDAQGHQDRIYDFYDLGIEHTLPISAEHNRGIDTLMEITSSLLPSKNKGQIISSDIQVALVGRPNVGKSSILNRLLHEEKNIVSPIPGTTRDPLDSYITYNKKRFKIIDTAGIRQKGKVRKDQLENYCVIRSFKSIDDSDIAIVVLDAKEGVTEQDSKIIGYAYEQGKALLLAFNKWDLIENKDYKFTDNFIKDVRYQLKFLPADIPLCFISAHHNLRIAKLLSNAETLYDTYTKRISTAELNKAFREFTGEKAQSILRSNNKSIKFYYCTQTHSKPPTFIIFTNRTAGLHFSQKRYLINQFRKNFDLTSVPIRLIFRSRDFKSSH